MAAGITDKFTKASNGTRPSPTTLTALKGIGDATISCGALTGWPTTTAVHFIIYTVDVAGAKVAGSQTDWKGIVSGTTITGLVLKAGTDNGYSVGAIVEAAPTAAYADDLAAGMTQDHTQLGYHSQLTDSNGNKVLGLGATGSAVNNVIATNAATGGSPTLTPEGETNVGIILRGKGSGRAMTDYLPPQTYVDEATYDFVASGGVWSGDSYGSTLAASMTAMVCYINGRRISISAVTARAFTASKDTYVDVLDNADGTGTLVYTEVANNAASPALAADSIRIAIIVSGAGSIANVGSVNQGQEGKLLPVASSTPYATTDSLGNLICPRDPSRKILGYRIVTSNQAFSTGGYADATGLSLPVIIPTGRKIRLTMSFPNSYSTTTGAGVMANIYDVTGSVQLTETGIITSTTGLTNNLTCSVITTPATTNRTYKVQGHYGNAGNGNTNVSATAPGFLMVELV